MSNNISNVITLTKCPICNASYSINIQLNRINDFNQLCYQCSKCHICFCALCRIFPFHIDEKCPKNEIEKLEKTTEKTADHIQTNQIPTCSCQKLDLNKLNFVNGSISHPNLDQTILKEILSVSNDYCEANLIQSDIKKQIFDVMNFYICNEHRNPHVFILGHKNDKEIDVKNACPICNCGQIPICPEHKFRHMTYKCCKCCSTAIHTELEGRKICFLCERCFQMSPLNVKVSDDSQDEKKCRFYPYQYLCSEIVGRCDKCERLFVI